LLPLDPLYRTARQPVEQHVQPALGIANIAQSARAHFRHKSKTTTPPSKRVVTVMGSAKAPAAQSDNLQLESVNAFQNCVQSTAGNAGGLYTLPGSTGVELPGGTGVGPVPPCGPVPAPQHVRLKTFFQLLQSTHFPSESITQQELPAFAIHVPPRPELIRGSVTAPRPNIQRLIIKMASNRMPPITNHEGPEDAVPSVPSLPSVPLPSPEPGSVELPHNGDFVQSEIVIMRPGQPGSLGQFNFNGAAQRDD
jgi:hypothetical protein